eukprot:1373685-Amorphochlora_amoeboformis.AAC.2
MFSLGMIERFGRFRYAATPGLHFGIPFIYKIAYKRSLKETALPIQPQTAITKDNVHVELDGAVYTKVVDAYEASYGIEDPEESITVLAQSAMRKQVGELELDELFLERERLNSGIAEALDEATKTWGIRVFRYEIADIHVDGKIRQAMEQQSNAERMRRAEVLESEGYRQKLINQSEGERQSEINMAEGKAQHTLLQAEAEAKKTRLIASAEAERIRVRSEATADGIKKIADALTEDGGKDAMIQRLAEQYLSELSEMAKSSKMVIVPDKPNDVRAVMATALGMFDGLKAKKD